MEVKAVDNKLLNFDFNIKATDVNSKIEYIKVCRNLFLENSHSSIENIKYNNEYCKQENDREELIFKFLELTEPMRLMNENIDLIISSGGKETTGIKDVKVNYMGFFDKDNTYLLEDSVLNITLSFEENTIEILDSEIRETIQVNSISTYVPSVFITDFEKEHIKSTIQKYY